VCVVAFKGRGRGLIKGLEEVRSLGYFLGKLGDQVVNM
jgi:hypothetical protein